MKKILSLLAVFGLTGSLALAQAGANTYVYQTFGQPVSLDPARAYDTGSGTILENVYETLYTYDNPRIDEFVPALATDYEVSEDGTSYTFTLREGVQFHSGNTMTCRDVEYSFERALVTADPDGAANYLMGNQLLGTQTDASDPEAYQAEVTFEMIDSAAGCVDDMTFQLNLTGPDPALIAILAYTAFSVVDSQWAIDNGQWDGTEATWTQWIGRDLTQESMQNQASGTGAYQVVSWEGNDFIASRFDDYWGWEDTAAEEIPAPENVVIRYIDEQSTRILALQQGDADRITLNERVAL
ncbi:MAG: ABC transporter substrate-binding protein, partial [Deinococcota bacterium]|nr:ABC transporter substrate-binding protein [Deinococcota bacterium]